MQSLTLFCLARDTLSPIAISTSAPPESQSLEEELNHVPYNHIDAYVASGFVGWHNVAPNSPSNDSRPPLDRAPWDISNSHNLDYSPIYLRELPSTTFTGPGTYSLNSSFNFIGFQVQPANFNQQRTPCPWMNCTESFVRSADVDRHIQSVHFRIKHHCYWIEVNGAPCNDNSRRGYYRLEKLRSHQRQKHGVALV